MKEYEFVNLRHRPELMEEAAAWFHDKWGVPKDTYLECMKAYLMNETEYGWYLCLDRDHIAGGLGVTANGSWCKFKALLRQSIVPVSTSCFGISKIFGSNPEGCSRPPHDATSPVCPYM